MSSDSRSTFQTTWNQNGQQTIQEVVDHAATRDTTLTAYYKANQEYPELAQDLYYQDFPSKFVLVEKPCKWKPRQQGYAIGRMYYTDPTAEVFTVPPPSLTDSTRTLGQS
jgi:hypothetical protein